MRSCKTLVIGIKHFSRSQVNYFGGIPVCLKRAICCKSRRRFFPRTTSFTARNAGESDFHLFFRCSSSVNGAWWDVCSTPGSSHLCTPQMWCSSDVRRRTHSWKTKWRFWVTQFTQKISPIAFVQSLALWCPCPMTIHTASSFLPFHHHDLSYRTSTGDCRSILAMGVDLYFIFCCLGWEVFSLCLEKTKRVDLQKY